MAHAQVPRLHGYGVLWDTGARCYRVRNETTGEWLLDAASGERARYSSFNAAFTAWRCFEVHHRPGEQ
ncbi:hypothetical protein ABTZ03_17595 [Kitasatospora sp. NPDC096077]|uniref:hypothetical protein n=1 Tax=Kitasatospora sp. NPDC096077 TaxID=3155544 RepID=UPI00332AF484